MAKMRIHQLAKELKITSKDLISKVSSLGIPVKNHMSTLDEEEVNRVRLQFSDPANSKVQEKRIGRRIIRRRRVRLTPPEAETQMEAESKPQEEIADKPESAAVTPTPEKKPEILTTLPTTPEAPVEKSAETEIGARREEEIPAKDKELSVVKTPEKGKTMPLEQEIAPESKKTMETARVKPEVPEIPEEETVIAKKEIEKTKQVKTDVAPSSGEKKAKEPEKKPPSKIAPKKEKKTRKSRKKLRKKEKAAIIISLPEKPVKPVDKSAGKISEDVVSRAPIDLEKTRKARISRKTKEKVPEKQKKEKQVEPFPLPEKKIRRFERRRVVSKEDLYTRKQLKTQRISKSRKAVRDARQEGEIHKTKITVPKAIKRRLKIGEAITVSNLAKRMGVAVAELIKKLMELGLMVNANQSIDFDTATLVTEEFGFETEKASFEEKEILQTEEDKEQDLEFRPPVVTIMGHVDHGKTSLLDLIRHTNVTEAEAGGITQHIGAYQVSLENGEVTFLDTPGHEAFTSMRTRGAQVTDLVVLVVAADDGVMQQTVEAINHSRAANIPILVALNKIDKPNANPEKVRRELAEHGLIPEEWGGDTTIVEVSAKKKVGIDDLLEMILLQSEILELKANPNKPARGKVIEAKLDRGRGPVATVLIQQGTLNIGDFFVCGMHYGKVRAIINSNGQRILKAKPSTPVEIQGLSGVPVAGDDFAVVASEKQGKMISDHRQRKQRESELSRSTKVTLEKLYDHMKEEEIKELKLILKTDVQGSLEAITDSLRKLQTDEIKVNIIHSATGGVSETDVMLASASNAIIIGFNVRADMKVMEIAEREQVDVRFYDVIYQLLSDIKGALEGMLEPEYKETVIGRAKVRNTFNIPKVGTVAGCYVIDGKIERGAKVRVLREDVVVYQGKINSLRRFKDDVKEVKSGYECGLGIENFNDIKIDDVIEAFVLEEIRPTLESDTPE